MISNRHFVPSFIGILDRVKTTKLLRYLLLCTTFVHIFINVHFHSTFKEFIAEEDNERCNDKILTPFFIESRYVRDFTRDEQKWNSTKTKKGIAMKVFVNRNEKTFERRKLYPTCLFSPESQKGPIPVLFLVKGRSGSSNTWLTLSKLAGGEPNESKEVFGSDEHQIDKFLEYLKSKKEGSWWLCEHMCATTKKHCGAAIAGFQWKPYVNSWTKPAAKGILKEIANHNSNKNRVAPKIRVIYMTRNPIDVLMSQTKHRTSDIAAHCNLNQKGCIERSKQSGTSKIYLETENLLSALQKSKDQQDLVESTLKMFGIDYYRTTYEELYNRGDADEWMKIFKYLNVGPMENLSLADVHDSFSLAKTTSDRRSEVLSNYKEIRKVLEGTEFLPLLEE